MNPSIMFPICTLVSVTAMTFAPPAFAFQGPQSEQSASDASVESSIEVEVKVEIANLVYSGTDARTGVCVSAGYLDLLARETNIKINRNPVDVAAESDDLFKYPFVVFTGEGDFVLTEREIKNLRSYLESGGFILASAGCSNSPWHQAFRREFKRIFPGRKLDQITLEHEIFHSVFEIDHLQTRRQSIDVELYGLQFNGRVGLVYSPQGLNDTGNAGGGCCCCGGNEIRNAKYLNANFLAYALTK